MRALICTAFALLVTVAHGQEWPEYTQKPEWIAELNERYAGRSGTFHDTSYPHFLARYAHDGDYLNWGKIREFRNDNEIVMHENGLPQVWQDEEPYWNAVVLAQFGLTMHGRIVLGDLSAEPMFWSTVDKLIELQRADGGFPYPP